MSKIINVTDFRYRLLKIINSNTESEKYIITKDNTPQSVLININDYETNYLKINKNLPVLIILGAKKCPDENSLLSIKEINLSVKYFSNIIFVYGDGTQKYIKKIEAPDLRSIKNPKSDTPLITSLKCGLTAVSDNKKFFIITLLSKPVFNTDYKKICEASKITKKGIILLTKNDKPTHPALFSIKYKDYFIKTRKELGIPYIIKKFKNDIKYL